MKKKSSRKSGTSTKNLAALSHHNDLPATVGLVKEVRAELVAEIGCVRSEMKSMEARLEGKIDHVLVETQKTREIAHQTQALAYQTQAIALQTQAAMHQTQALMEEQRAENRIVLDGLKSVMARQDRTEDTLQKFGETLHFLVTAKDKPV